MVTSSDFWCSRSIHDGEEVQLYYVSHWNGPWCLTWLGIYKSWDLYSTETRCKETGFQTMCTLVHVFVWNIHLLWNSSLISQRNSNSHHFSVTSWLEIPLLFHASNLSDTSRCLLHRLLFSIAGLRQLCTKCWVCSTHCPQSSFWA